MGGKRKHSKLPDETPWLILPEEDVSQWEAFQAYLTMEPPRSIRRLAEERQKSSIPTVYQWAKQHHWRKRAYAYDLWLAKQEMASVVEERLRIRREQLRIAEKTRQLAERKMNELRALASLSKLSPKDALAMMKESVAIERLILGEATERHEQVQWDLSSLTKDQVDELERIYKAAQGEDP